MKYRARANGNILDGADVPESLIGVLYDPVDEDGAPEPAGPEPDVAPAPLPRGSALITPEAPVLTTAHTSEPRSRRRRKGR